MSNINEIGGFPCNCGRAETNCDGYNCCICDEYKLCEDCTTFIKTYLENVIIITKHQAQHVKDYMDYTFKDVGHTDCEEDFHDFIVRRLKQ